MLNVANQVTAMFQLFTGIAMIFISITTILIPFSVKPELRRSDVFPLSILTGTNEFLFGCVLIASFFYRSNPMIFMILLTALMICTATALFLRLYHINLLRSIYMKDTRGQNGTSD